MTVVTDLFNAARRPADTGIYPFENNHSSKVIIMFPVAGNFRPTKGQTTFYTHVITRALAELAKLDLSLASVDYDEFMAINRRYEDKGWYALHPHYRHDRFLGLAVVTRDMTEVMGLIGYRPAQTPGKSLGAALEDLSFIYPDGAPEGAQDRFDDVPFAAYGLTGNGAYFGGFWLNPGARARSGLAGSALLSYLTRAMYACALGADDPDFAVCLVIDNILRGREKGRSILDRYGFKYAAAGPIWVNHYPGETLAMNTAWIDRAGLMNVLIETPWVEAGALAIPRAA